MTPADWDASHHVETYAREGRALFPVKPWDKTPFVSQYQATSDLDVLAAWWRMWPDALIGCRVPLDCLVLDIDPRHGGDTTWDALEREYGPIRVGRMHFSGRGDGGFHAWFARPDDLPVIIRRRLDDWAREHETGAPVPNYPNRWTSGIDPIYHTWRYTILPPSPHPDTGQPYRWREVNGALIAPPAPLVELLRPVDGHTDTATDDGDEEREGSVPLDDLGHSDSIADWFSATRTWAEILEPHGWKLVHGDGDSNGSLWRHRDATTHHSASIKYRCLFVYSPNTLFEPTDGETHGYTRFAAWALLEYGGDQSAAASAARGRKNAEEDAVRAHSNATTSNTAPRSAPQLGPAALYGILGDIVTTIRPHTEACDAALLFTALVQVGNYLGRGPHVMVESDRHGCALFAVLVGESARARKGTGAGRIEALMRHVDPLDQWRDECVTSGFGSGEALIDRLDNTTRTDPRLFIDEREMAALLTVASRDGSIYSSVLRNLWDGQPLRNKVKGKANKLLATDHHGSVLGHVTGTELGRLLTSTEQSNGFANRFLWVYTYRARRLPHGGALDAATLSRLGKRLAAVVRSAQNFGQVTMTEPAKRRWEVIYDEIADQELPGIAAALTNRAEAQTLRLALLYAALDASPRIDVAQLEAGWAAWRYCQASVLHIWRDATGDLDLDRLVTALRAIAPAGMTTTEAHETVFAKHKAVAPIATRGVRCGLIRIERESTATRAREVLYAV
jgi:hypothetical protein